MKTPVQHHDKATEYLAAERTFLAWIRTSIAVLSLGFVIAKFGVWLRELASRLDPQVSHRSTGMSLPTGIAMMGFGAIFAAFAAWRYHRLNRAIELGEVKPDRWLIALITVVVVIVAVVMIVYMIKTADQV